MKTLLTLTLALVAATSVLPAVPAFARAPSAGAVPYCSSNAGADHNLRRDLELQLLVKKQYILALDDWNGCLKAITVDSHGKSAVTYYDDTLSVVRQDS